MSNFNDDFVGLRNYGVGQELDNQLRNSIFEKLKHKNTYFLWDLFEKGLMFPLRYGLHSNIENSLRDFCCEKLLYKNDSIFE